MSLRSVKLKTCWKSRYRVPNSLKALKHPSSRKMSQKEVVSVGAEEKAEVRKGKSSTARSRAEARDKEIAADVRASLLPPKLTQSRRFLTGIKLLCLRSRSLLLRRLKTKRRQVSQRIVLTVSAVETMTSNKKNDLNNYGGEIIVV